MREVKETVKRNNNKNTRREGRGRTRRSGRGRDEKGVADEAWIMMVFLGSTRRGPRPSGRSGAGSSNGHRRRRREGGSERLGWPLNLADDPESLGGASQDGIAERSDAAGWAVSSELGACLCRIRRGNPRSLRSRSKYGDQ